MANGSHKPGPAMADRIREEGAKHGRWLQQSIDEERNRELPSYRSEQDSEITVNKEGLKVRSAFPRVARIAIGFGLGFLFCSLGVAVVLHFAK